MLKIISSDLNARKITLQYVRPDDNPFGNQAVSVIVQATNPFGDKRNGTTVFKNSLDPSHPEYLIIPTAGEIEAGKVFDIDSYKLGLTKSEDSYLTFRDGVLDIDIAIGAFDVNMVGEEGNSFVTGSGFIDILTNYDAIIVDNVFYRLLKDRSSNAGTVMYLDKPLHRGITSATVALVDNLKIYNDYRTKQAICGVATILTENSYYRPYLDEKRQAVLKLLTNKQASSLLFDNKSYLEADRLLNESLDIINWLQI